MSGRARMSGDRGGWAVIVTACTFALTLAAPVPAQAGAEAAGTTAAAFLGVGTGAGVLGRGGATLALAGDLAIVPWNPASLGWLGETQIAIAHAGLEDEALQEWVGVGGKVGRSALRWSLDGLYQSEGPFEGRDALNQPTGGIDVSSMAMALHLARPFGRFVSLGVGGKYVGERLGEVSGAGFTMDAGLQVRAGLLGLGVAVTNVGGQMAYDGQRYGFPTSVGVGAALDLPLTGLRLAVDADFPRSYYEDVRAGAEWRWHNLVALRAGYRRELGAPENVAESGPSFGVGAGLRGMWLDYGYLIPGAGEGQHRLSVTLQPGKFAWLSGDPFGQKDMPKDFDHVRPGDSSAPQRPGEGASSAGGGAASTANGETAKQK